MEFKMKERKYLLSIKELKTELERDGLHSSLVKQALEKLDTHRREKALKTARPRKCAESIGAGLLLQLGLQEFYGDNCKIQKVNISEVLSNLNPPTEVTYRYGEKGKPYFADIPLYFSISHCEDYVLCVFSKQEIGADIQYKKPIQEEGMVQRFFSPREKVIWEQCSNPEEQKDLFYRLWARKEAYGKLTGKGIGETIAMDMEAPDVWFEEYELENNYRIAICKLRPE